VRVLGSGAFELDLDDARARPIRERRTEVIEEDLELRDTSGARERERREKALTGEGRLSGVVLIALPFALFGFMLNAKPDYIEPLWTTELGQKMSVFAIIAQILGALVIKKIVNIKV